MMDLETVQYYLMILAAIMLSGLVLFLLLIGFAVRQLRKIDIPVDAGFVETLQLVPLSMVVAIDLLDLSLDVLAAPVAWVMLDRLGLKALRGLSAVEAVIPGTQFIPTLTLCWLGIRVLRLGPVEKRPTRIN